MIDENTAPTAVMSRPAAVVHLGLLSLAGGYSMMIAIHRPPLAAMAGGALLTTARRSELLHSLVLWSLVTAAVLAAVVLVTRRRDGWPATTADLAAGLWPFSLLPLAWHVFDVGVWSAAPVLLYAITTAACGACVARTRLPGPRRRRRLPESIRRRAPSLIVAAAITAYVGYVSLHTILNHWSLGTSAFDLGIQENTLWNTIHGDILHSSLMHGHYLGVHTSFILLLIAPVYAIAPATETLLVLQALALGLTAWPLFVAARGLLGSDTQAVVIALLWLGHPAVGGANFYDFHPVAFAPLALCSAAVFWWRQRWRWFWLSAAVLLSVKEEMAIVAVLLGIVMAWSGERRHGLGLAAVGAAAYVVLQHVVIPHFAGGAHSYSWYYTDMIPAGEGPRGLLTTALLNPVHTIGFALTPAKVLYAFQLFAPLAFLTFAAARGWLLVSYGLAATLLATRPPLHQIGFQYALTLLALGFLGALLALECFDARRRTRALALAVMLAAVTCFHYGMIWPRHHFRGGFSFIDFDYSAADRARYRELEDLVAGIPADATVLASERLVPHVARRHTVETTRHVRPDEARDFDVVLTHADERPPQGLARHRVEATTHFKLYTRPEPTE